MVEEWNIRDSALYRDIGGKKHKKGEVVLIKKDEEGKVIQCLLKVEGEENELLACKPSQLIKIRKKG